MTIDEAMTYLSILVEVKRQLGKDKEATAIQLGLEALKRIRGYRARSILDELDTIPGETE